MPQAESEYSAHCRASVCERTHPLTRTVRPTSKSSWTWASRDLPQCHRRWPPMIAACRSPTVCSVGTAARYAVPMARVRSAPNISSNAGWASSRTSSGVSAHPQLVTATTTPAAVTSMKRRRSIVMVMTNLPCSGHFTAAGMIYETGETSETGEDVVVVEPIAFLTGLTGLLSLSPH